MLNQCYPINEEAYEEWREFRHKEKRCKIGPMAEKKQRKFLANYPPHIQQHIIDTSINASWQGLFPPKGLNNEEIGHRFANTRRLSAVGEVRAARERAQTAREGPIVATMGGDE